MFYSGLRGYQPPLSKAFHTYWT